MLYCYIVIYMLYIYVILLYICYIYNIYIYVSNEQLEHDIFENSNYFLLGLPQIG